MVCCRKYMRLGHVFEKANDYHKFKHYGEAKYLS